MTKHPIPDSALDGRLAIVGISGSGKSTTAKGGVERLLAQGRRVCIVDLLDGWWGLRVKRDGHTPAFPVAIFGGLHGDLPLTEHAGDLIGQAVARSEGSSIISLSELDGDAPRRRFALAFFNALHKTNRAPLHLVVDEADFYAPQTPVKEGPGPLLLNRVKEIAARGRLRGFRCWPITQRPAKLHKDVLSQADTLIAMQLTSSQDRAAIEGWIGDQGDKAIGKTILASLPGLQQGQGVLWAPRLGILNAERFPLPATYDSSRTPEYGEKIPDVELKPIDLGALREKMGKVEAETKANDPKALRREIADLKKQLAANPTAAVFDQATLAAEYQRGVTDGFANAGKQLEAETAKMKSAIDHARDLLIANLPTFQRVNIPHTPKPAERAPALPQGSRPVTASKAVPAGGELPAALQRVVNAIGWWRKIGFDVIERSRACVVAGYSPNASTFGVYIGQLVQRGLVTVSPGMVALTDAGLALAVVPEGDSREDLKRAASDLLKPQERRVFEAVYAAYPNEISRDDVAEALGLSKTASTVGVYIGAVAAYGIIEKGSPGHVKAANWLFP